MPELTRIGRWFVFLVLAAAAAACGVATPAADGPGAAVRELSGAHTRVVWVQHDGKDPRLEGTDLVLMGFDSDDGKGERVILGKPSSYVKPMIAPRGDRIVFSTRPKPGPPEVFVVNWDGTGLEKLVDGMGMALWEDPSTRREWLYYGTDSTGWDTSIVRRLPLDDPGRHEAVWTGEKISMEGFKLSRDGRFASGLVPWPKAGVVELATGRTRVLGNGCWTSLTDARGPLLWYFDGAHRNVTLVDVDSDTRWMVNVNNAPGFDGAEVFHPRWTNHPRVLVISGPYNQGGRNQARTGGPQVEIYLGRFSADYASIESWARVTRNDRGDSHPDAWIDLSRSKLPQRPSGPLGPEHVRTAGKAGGAAGGDEQRVVLNVELTRAGSVPTPQEILPYRNALVVNDYKISEVVRGTFKGKSIQIAQWAIRDGRVLPEARRIPGTGLTVTVDPYDAHPELEGERLISDVPARGTLYYEVTK